VASVPAVPVPQSVVDQAERQAEGDFTGMSRSTVGGQIQEAWDEADDSAGVARFDYCEICTYKVRLRQHMVTVIELPEGEIIERADAGDTAEFRVEQRQKNRLSIKPRGFGVDSNLIVFGKSGAVYPIYIRAEKFNSVNVPDLYVQIVGTVTVPEIEVEGIGANGYPPGTENGPAKMTVPDTKTSGTSTPDPDDDFVKDIPFDPDRLRGWDDYELWGGGPHVDDLKGAIKAVFKDDVMTFIRFNDKWPGVELPTAYIVVDGIDEVVNTRLNGRTYTIESTQRLITLKSGETYICIKYVGAT
jgi:ComB9 competence protein